MLSFIRSILGKKTGKQTEAIVRGADGKLYENGVEVPISPPFAKGIYVVSTAALLESQKELIDRIYGTLSFSREEFDKLALPVIERYAGWVHLLPASEAHHHKTAGGLFRHGLEVAFYAAQSSRGCIFGTGSTPTDRRNNEPRWRLAAMLAGLLHDIGKPVSDYVVTSAKGEHVWHPHLTTINEWAAQNRIDRYFLKWTDKRNKMHESYSATVLGTILPAETKHFLHQGGPEIFVALSEAICGLSAIKPLAKLMIEADQNSVAKDLRENRISATDQDYGLPVERFIFDAIRSMVNSGEWTTNTIGSRVWHFKEHGVFIALRQGAAELYSATQKTQVPGIPREADTIADILIDRGHAIAQPISGTTATDRYWQFKTTVTSPEGQSLNVSLVLLKLESASLIFSTEPPAAIDGELENTYAGAPAKPAKKVPAKQTANDKAKAEDTQSAEQQIIEEQSAASKRPMDFNSLMSQLKGTDSNQPEPEEEPEVPVQLAPQENIATDTATTTQEDIHPAQEPQAIIANPDAETIKADPVQAPVEVPVIHDIPTEGIADLPIALIEQSVEQELPAHAIKGGQDMSSDLLTQMLEEMPTDEPEDKASPQDILNGLLENLSDKAQQKLTKIVGAVLKREQPLGITLSRIQGGEHALGVPYPSGINAAFPDESPSETLTAFAEAGVIIPDPVFPTKNVHTIQNDKFLIFSPELEVAILAALSDIEMTVSSTELNELFGDIPAPRLIGKAKGKKKRNKPAQEAPQTEVAQIEAAPATQSIEVAAGQSSEPNHDSTDETIQTKFNTSDANDNRSSNCNVETFAALPTDTPWIPEEGSNEDCYGETYYRHDEDEDEFEPEACELKETKAQQQIDDEAYREQLLDSALIETKRTAEDVEIELRRQVLLGEGNWIVSGVKKVPKGLEVSADSLRIASAKYAGTISESKIVDALLENGWVVGRKNLTLKVSK